MPKKLPEKRKANNFQTMSVIHNIVVIGAGNVASFFANSLFTQGFHIVQILNRSGEKARMLAERVNASYTADFSMIDINADVYILAVSDDALPGVIEKIPPVKGIVVHTSGSTNLSVFSGLQMHYGVIYPLQTISMNKVVKPESVPLFIEASDKGSLKKISGMANTISNQVRDINSAQRLALHVSAVFVCNYVNYLYSVGFKILETEGLDPSWLLPLIDETAQKIHTMNPNAAQTGPARRRIWISLRNI